MHVVRAAEPADQGDLQAIFEHALRGASWLPGDADVDTDLLRNSSGETAFVALTVLGEITGFMSVYAPGKFIHHLYVKPQFQRQGVGAALLASLDAWLPRPWYLKCVVANGSARAFYNGTGWAETETHIGSQGQYVVFRRFAAAAGSTPPGSALPGA